MKFQFGNIAERCLFADQPPCECESSHLRHAGDGDGVDAAGVYRVLFAGQKITRSTGRQIKKPDPAPFRCRTRSACLHGQPANGNH